VLSQWFIESQNMYCSDIYRVTYVSQGVGPRTMWISIGGCVFFGAYEGAKSAIGGMID